MVEADARKETLKQAEATLKANTAENEKEKEHARQQTAEDEKQLAELDAQRKELAIWSFRRVAHPLRPRAEACAAPRWLRFTKTKVALPVEFACVPRSSRT